MEFDSSKVTTDTIGDEIESIGFDARLEASTTPMKRKLLATLSIDGMTCATCSGAIEKGLKKVDGISAV